MPYISSDRREALDHTLKSDCVSKDEGGLNFQISRLLNEWIANQTYLESDPRIRLSKYSAINNAIGVLECAKLELYRRLAVPHEDRKIDENGDVYSIGNLT